MNNEIIIGLTPKKDKNDKKKKPKKNLKNSRPQKKETKKKKSAQINKKQTKKKKRNLKILKWTSLAVLIITAITLFMTSSIFNIKEIIVENNIKISSEEIISLSKLTTGVNMFKTSNKSIINNIKINPYIENVKVKKDLAGAITLKIQERIPTYMLKFANAYVYINNQGYMLEITETPLELPIITGFETQTEQIDEGNRLVVEDLKKLEDVIKIIEVAKNNSLANIITEIDISDSTNYILKIASEDKTIQFGDIKNINIKLLKIEALIEQEKGIKGEIYFQGSDKTVFKEQV
ncbi:MAG: FtsQ-type POTRA domain-containing protein [Clostridia bacterium]|nr:FtsQ-type POTRA domain-containing protein [Clostridia bacterium]